MPRRTWNRLAKWSEQLTAETCAAELEILHQPLLLDELGLPRAIRNILKQSTPLTPAITRVMRFDFHYTTQGWRISEVNSDVPGGFAEASDLTAAMAAHYPPAQPAGDPASAWAEAIARSAKGGRVALLAAPGYMEDQQIMAYLARKLATRGCTARLATPGQIQWKNGIAHLDSTWFAGELAAVVRFYQGEWLARLPLRCGWPHFFRGGRTPVSNAGLALISESKRFPLVWDRLRTALPAWRALLPETRHPRAVDWTKGDKWVLKSALSNNGDAVCMRELMSARVWRGKEWSARLFPGALVAQRRFEPAPLRTSDGPVYPCIGVYTIDGRAAGAYARYSPKQLIDFAAIDVALLVTADE